LPAKEHERDDVLLRVRLDGEARRPLEDPPVVLQMIGGERVGSPHGALKRPRERAVELVHGGSMYPPAAVTARNDPEDPDAVTHPRATAALGLAALGVVYGDIGTSPLYALRECF